jgi:butyryl-CoA dehydrogenase
LTFPRRALSTEHFAFQNLCQKFAASELQPFAADNDRNESFPGEQIAKMGELGLMGICAAPEYGGCGLDTTSLSIAVEEVSRGCSGTGTICSVHNSLYVNLVNRLGDVAQKEEFLRPYTKGTLGVFALSESDAGSDVSAMRTTARKDSDGSWVLNGTKRWVTSGIEAKAGVVFATIDKSKGHKGITAFLVSLDTPGLERGRVEKKLGIRASSTCDLILNDIRVPANHVLGELGGGFRIAMDQLNQGRIGIASQALGIAQAALDAGVKYADQRVAFGRRIIEMPVVQTRLAEMATRVEAARLMVRKAAAEYDATQGRSTKYSSMGKLLASETATFCAHNCQQIMGAMGYVNDLPGERLYRDARITEIYGGISDIQKMVIAEQVLKEYGVKKAK